MTATTATQGFIYATGTDSPTQTPATVTTLVGQMDTKANGYDTDGARVVANNFAKVSRSNFTTVIINGAFQFPTFDTMEVNRGTASDLTVWNQGLILGTGYWMVGYEAIWNGLVADSGVDTQLWICASNSGNGQTGTWPICQQHPERDNGGTFGNAGNTGTFTTGVQGGTVSSLFQVSAANQLVRVHLFRQSAISVVYHTLWAFQIGDL